MLVFVPNVAYKTVNFGASHLVGLGLALMRYIAVMPRSCVSPVEQRSTRLDTTPAVKGPASSPSASTARSRVTRAAVDACAESPLYKSSFLSPAPLVEKSRASRCSTWQSPMGYIQLLSHSRVAGLRQRIWCLAQDCELAEELCWLGTCADTHIRHPGCA